MATRELTLFGFNRKHRAKARELVDVDMAGELFVEKALETGVRAEREGPDAAADCAALPRTRTDPLMMFSARPVPAWPSTTMLAAAFMPAQ